MLPIVGNVPIKEEKHQGDSVPRMKVNLQFDIVEIVINMKNNL